MPLPPIAMALAAPFNPVPRADQADPSHLAILLVLATPPANVKAPPTYTMPLPPIAMALAAPLNPVPRADQADPFHLAM